MKVILKGYGWNKTKGIWMKATSIDLKKSKLLKDLAVDRFEWRNRIHIVHSNKIRPGLWSR